MSTPARTVVVGLGNPVRGDDSVGLAVAEKLVRLLGTRPIDGVVVRAADRAGLEIIDLLADADNAVIVDCLEVQSPLPGRVRILGPGDVGGSARLTGGQDIGIGAALELGRLLGIRMPENVVIVGIEGADPTVLREELTPGVALAATRVAAWLHLGLRLGLRCALAWLVERPLPNGALAVTRRRWDVRPHPDTTGKRPTPGSLLSGRRRCTSFQAGKT